MSSRVTEVVPTPITTAIIGLGKIGFEFDLQSGESQVFSHAKAVKLHPAFVLAAGVDPSSEKREAFSKATGAPTYATVEELYGQHDPALVIVAAPTALHAPLFAAIAPRAPRLVLMEKPLAASVEEATRIAELAKKHSVPICVNYMRAFDPGLMALADAVRARHWGTLVNGRVVYSRGILTNASHYLHLLLHWFGPVLEERVFAARPAPADIPFDLNVDAAIRFSDGWVTVQSVSSTEFGIGEVDLLFERGRITLPNFTEAIRLHEVEAEPKVRGVRRLISGEFPVQPQMERYQLNVLTAISGMLAEQGSFEGALNLAVDTIGCCERLIAAAQTMSRAKGAMI